MRYLAILRDSLREALDSKVLYVIIALSTLVIGVAAGLSFKPQSARTTMEMFFPKFGPPLISMALETDKPETLLAKNPEMMKLNARRPARTPYFLEKVELVRGEPDAPESDYELIIAQGNWRQGSPPPNGGDDLEAPLKEVREIFQEADDLGFIRVESVGYVENVAPEAVKQFRVKICGTPLTHRILGRSVSIFTFPMDGLVGIGPLGFLIYQISTHVLKIGAWVAVLAGIVITAFFIPNMLRKGTVEMLLVKPLHRWVLLAYKYLGGLAFIFLANAYAIGGIWLVLGIRSGLWANAMLLLILTLTFFFAILYAVSTLIAVVTRSIITTIMLTLLAWVVFAIIGMFYNGMQVVGRIEKEFEKQGHAVPEEERWGDGKLALAARLLHAITPRTEDLNRINDVIVFTSLMTGNLADIVKLDSSDRNWLESLLVSGAWIVIFLGLSSLWFTFKDY